MTKVLRHLPPDSVGLFNLTVSWFFPKTVCLHYWNILYQAAVRKVTRTLSQTVSRCSSNKVAVSRFVTRLHGTESGRQEKIEQLSVLTAENFEEMSVWFPESLRELASHTHARTHTHTDILLLYPEGCLEISPVTLSHYAWPSS
jgi:hypothetical protein